MEIVIASGNRSKIAELSTIAAELPLSLRSPLEVSAARGLGEAPAVDEVGTTYYQNALLKAQAYQQWASMPALGDDSGLEVDLLDGRPGLHSARYGGGGLSDRERCALLLRELRATARFEPGVSAARFRCCLVLVWPSGERISAESTLEGVVLDEFRGDQGFGYDPVIYVPELQCTLAELSFSEVCRRGFRAQAAQKLFKTLLG